MVLVCKFLFKSTYLGISIWPFIIVKHAACKEDVYLMNHEYIHLQQQKELLILPFYIWYVAEWVYGCVKYKNRHEAYRNISFEKEAYANESNLAYLKTRRRFNFMKYS
jgi:hypothetical protein